MKELLKELYIKNRRDFEVWNYLWLFSSNNEIEFNTLDLSIKFNLPMSSLHRILKTYPDNWNENKTFVQHKKHYRLHRITFYPKGKAIPKSKNRDFYDDLFDWLKNDYYSELDFDYVDLIKHKPYIKTICNKLKKAMLEKSKEFNDELLISTFKLMFTSIDDWWKDSGNITLVIINKNFTKILNQVKKNGNKSKRDSFSKAAAKVDEVDFSKFTDKS